MGDLTKNFSRCEFACKCGCGFDEIEQDFVDRLQIVRQLYGPMKIISGCRCEEHNKKEGGRQTSSHLIGWATDIYCPNNYSRFRLVDLLREEGFERIGLGNGFVHVDDDPGKAKEVIWLY